MTSTILDGENELRDTTQIQQSKNTGFLIACCFVAAIACKFKAVEGLRAWFEL